MNNLKLNEPAGYPFDLTSLDFMQVAIRDAFTAVLSPWLTDYLNQVMVITGCQPSFGSDTISSGWVYFKGEICRVDAGPIDPAISEPSAHWALVETFDGTLHGNTLDPTPNVDNTGIKNIHAVRKVRLQAATAGSIAWSNTFYFDQRVQAQIISDTWHIIGAGGEPAFVTGSASTPAPAFRLSKLGTVEMRGAWVAPAYGSAVWQTLCVLPLGYRPTAGVRRFSIHSSDPGTVDYFKIQILTTGEVQLAPDAAVVAGKIIFIDTVRFSL
jgi:hypothetical protein